LKPKMIGSGLSYEMRVIRSVNTLHVDNLGPSSIGGTHVEISVHFNMKTIYIYIYI
jgi:homoserine kinase